jgi:hypothetical protein
LKRLTSSELNYLRDFVLLLPLRPRFAFATA